MAIGVADVALWYRLRELGAIPENPGVLEIGEANWYGDYPIEQLVRDIHTSGHEHADLLVREIVTLARVKPTHWQFQVAKLFYAATLRATSISAIDLHGTPYAYRHDLNEKTGFEKQVDIVINTGTAEHVFNVAQVFITTHDACRPGGLMVHTFPVVGWLDHGFWNVNPTLIHDTEATNEYERLACYAYDARDPQRGPIPLGHPSDELAAMRKSGELTGDVMLHVAWRKTADAPFRVPMQGYYAGTRKEWTAFATA